MTPTPCPHIDHYDKPTSQPTVSTCITMKLAMFSPREFLASLESPTTLKSLGGSEPSQAQKLSKLFTFNSIASPTAKEISACTDDIPLIEGVDHLIAGKTDTEARSLLRRMVLDLMNEVDHYRGRLQVKEKLVSRLEEERSIISQDSRDKLFSLMLSLQKLTGESVTVQLEPGKELSSEDATDLVVSELTKKINQLTVTNTNLVNTVNEMRGSMDDLECENEARLHKVDALEMQFKSINKTRQKVVSRLTDRSAKESMRQSDPSSQGRYLETN